MSIGTCLLILIQGVFLDGKVKLVAHDNKLKFQSRDSACLSSPKQTSEAQGQARKEHGNRNPTCMMGHTLFMLTFMNQKGALSHERAFGSSLDPLSFGVNPGKFPANSSAQLLDTKNLYLKSLNNATGEELMVFDSD